MASASVIDVDLVRRMLAAKRPMDEIVAKSGASVESVDRIRRAFPTQIAKTAAGLSKWSEHAAELRQFHLEGRTSTWVAAHYGVTRNAIIGIWSRMGLRSKQRRHRAMTPEQARAAYAVRVQKRNERQNKMRADRRAQDAATAAPRRTQASILNAILSKATEPMAMHDDATLPKDLIPILIKNDDGRLVENPALTNDVCRWWVGAPEQPGAGFCPETKVAGLSYCQHHARAAYAPPTVRRPRASAQSKPERIPTFADAE